MLFHAGVCHEQVLELIHLKLIVLATSRCIDEDKILAAVACNRLLEVGGGVDDLDGKSQNLGVFFELLHR